MALDLGAAAAAPSGPMRRASSFAGSTLASSIRGRAASRSHSPADQPPPTLDPTADVRSPPPPLAKPRSFRVLLHTDSSRVLEIDQKPLPFVGFEPDDDDDDGGDQFEQRDGAPRASVDRQAWDWEASAPTPAAAASRTIAMRSTRSRSVAPHADPRPAPRTSALQPISSPARTGPSLEVRPERRRSRARSIAPPTAAAARSPTRRSFMSGTTASAARALEQLERRDRVEELKQRAAPGRTPELAAMVDAHAAQALLAQQVVQAHRQSIMMGAVPAPLAAAALIERAPPSPAAIASVVPAAAPAPLPTPVVLAAVAGRRSVSRAAPTRPKPAKALAAAPRTPIGEPFIEDPNDARELRLTLARSLELAANPRSLVLAGARLWLSSSDGSVEIRDATSTDLVARLALRSPSPPPPSMTATVAAAAAATHITCLYHEAASDRVWLGASDGSLQVWASDARARIGVPFQAHHAAVRCIAGRASTIWTAADDWTLVQRDANGAQVAVASQGRTWVKCMVVAADDGALWAGTEEGVRVWSARHGRLRALLSNGHAGAVVAMCLVGACVWSAGADGSLAIWRSRDGALLRRHERAHRRWVYRVVPVGARTVWSLDAAGVVCAWDARTGTLRSARAPSERRIVDVAVGGGDDGQVWVAYRDPAVVQVLDMALVDGTIDDAGGMPLAYVSAKAGRHDGAGPDGASLWQLHHVKAAVAAPRRSPKLPSPSPSQQQRAATPLVPGQHEPERRASSAPSSSSDENDPFDESRRPSATSDDEPTSTSAVQSAIANARAKQRAPDGEPPPPKGQRVAGHDGNTDGGAGLPADAPNHHRCRSMSSTMLSDLGESPSDGDDPPARAGTPGRAAAAEVQTAEVQTAVPYPADTVRETQRALSSSEFRLDAANRYAATLFADLQTQRAGLMQMEVRAAAAEASLANATRSSMAIGASVQSLIDAVVQQGRSIDVREIGARLHADQQMEQAIGDAIDENVRWKQRCDEANLQRERTEQLLAAKIEMLHAMLPRHVTHAGAGTTGGAAADEGRDAARLHDLYVELTEANEAKVEAWEAVRQYRARYEASAAVVQGLRDQVAGWQSTRDDRDERLRALLSGCQTHIVELERRLARVVHERDQLKAVGDDDDDGGDVQSGSDRAPELVRSRRIMMQLEQTHQRIVRKRPEHVRRIIELNDLGSFE